MAALCVATAWWHLAPDRWAVGFDFQNSVIPRRIEPSEQILDRHAQRCGERLNRVKRRIGAASLYA